MEEPTNPRPLPWKLAILAAVAVALVGVGFLALYRTGSAVMTRVDRGLDSVGQAIAAAPAIAQKFRTGTITHTFRESIPQIGSTEGDILEVAVSRGDETFSRSDERWTAWNQLYLGTTEAEIRVPVTFRYHVRLSDAWRLDTRDHVCLVVAPAVRPSLPPAIHTESMEKRAESGWARFDKDEILGELEKGLTPALTERAGDQAHLALVREASRQSIAAFVRRWLMREDHWRTDRFSSIVVVFPDEAGIETGADLEKFEREPTVRLDPK